MKDRKYTETDLLNGFINNDSDIINYFYKKNRDYFRIFVKKISYVIDDKIAYDFYQDAMIIFLEKIKDKNFRLTCKLNVFLFGIGRNLCLNYLDKHNKRYNYVDNYDSYIENFYIENDYKDQFVDNIILNSINTLSIDEKKIIKGFFYDDKSLTDILKEVNYKSYDVLKTKKYKIMQKLKKQLTQNYNKEFLYENI